MKINPGEAVTISATSSNATDAPFSAQWKPKNGKTYLEVTITNKAGDKETHVFTINAKVHS